MHIEIVAHAYKHGFTKSHILYAYSHVAISVPVLRQDKEPQWNMLSYLANGTIIELCVIQKSNGLVSIIHANKPSKQFLQTLEKARKRRKRKN